MERKKPGGDEHLATKRTFIKLSGTERRSSTNPQILFDTAHQLPAADSSDEVENNSGAFENKRSATSRLRGKKYSENIKSRKRSREDNSENNGSGKRRSVSRESDLKNWLSELIQLRNSAHAPARVDEADIAGAAEQFPSTTISEEHVNNNASCVVCLDPFEVGEDAREMPCNHIFHKHCIYKWLSMNPTCPVCRYNFLSPPLSTSGDHNSQSPSLRLPRSRGFSAYQPLSKEFSGSPSRRSFT